MKIQRLLVLVILLSSGMAGNALAGNEWTGGGTDNLWTDSNNWGGAVPGAGQAITFAGTTNLTVDNNNTSEYTMNGLTFASGAGAFILEGAHVIDKGITAINDSATGVTETVDFGGTSELSTANSTNTTISVVSGGTLDLEGAWQSSAEYGTITMDGTGTINLSWSSVIEANTLAISGTGTIVNVSSSSALGNGTQAASFGTITVASGSVLQLQNNITIDSGNATGVNALTLNGTGVNSNGALENVSGSNTFGGTIALGSAASIGSDTGTLTLSNLNAITGNYALTLVGAGNGILDGGIGTSSLTMNGTGTWVLNGSTSSYAGATSVNSGTLELANSASLGTTAVTVSSNATLSVNNSAYIGLGSAGASLTVNGGGKLALAGGGVNNTLTISGASNGTVLTLGGASAAANLSFDVGSAAGASNTDTISASGYVTVAGGGVVITINALSDFGVNDYELISANQITYTTPTNVTLAGGDTLDGYDVALNLTSTGLYLDVTAEVASPPVLYWTGADGTNTWTDPNNFSTTSGTNTPATAVPGPATDVVFGTSSPTPTNLSTTLDAATTINSLTFDTSSDVTIASGAGGTASTLTIEATSTTNSGGINVAPNGINDEGSGAVTISAPVDLGTNQTWTNSSTNTLTVSGVVGDNGNQYGLTTAGSGVIALTTSNTYSGNTTVTSGTLLVTGSIVSPTTTITGGTLQGDGLVKGIVVNSGGNVTPGAAGFTPAETLSSTVNNVLTATSLTLNGGSSLTYNLYSGSVSPPIAEALGGNVINLSGGALTFEGLSSGADALTLDFNSTGTVGFGTLTNGIPAVYDLITDFSTSNLTAAQLNSDLSDGDIVLDDLTSSGMSGTNAIPYADFVIVGSTGDFTLELNVVPEPSAWAMFALGLGLLVVYQRKRRRQD